MRLELIGGTITFLTSLFGVIGRDQNWGVSPEKLGLSISYALTVSAVLNWLIWVTSELESNIVSVERIKEYTEVPQEVNQPNFSASLILTVVVSMGRLLDRIIKRLGWREVFCEMT